MTTDNPQSTSDETIEIELLPCPFCGGPAAVYRFISWYGQCKMCHAKSGTAQNTRREAAEIWNRRTPTTL